MPRFNVGDRVRLSEQGRCTYSDNCGDIYGNPHNDIGTIDLVDEGVEYLYEVKWDCGVMNQYLPDELELVVDEPQRKRKRFAQWVKDLEAL